jgi:SAM-dependent methyltransferase
LGEAFPREYSTTIKEATWNYKKFGRVTIQIQRFCQECYDLDLLFCGLYREKPQETATKRRCLRHIDSADGETLLKADASSYWDGVAQTWEQHIPQKIWRLHCDMVYAAWLGGLLPPALSQRFLKTDVFDEAVSGGVFPLLASRATQVMGIDLSHHALQMAGTRYAAYRLLGGDVRGLPFKEASFDCVISLSTLDHLSSCEEIAVSLGEIYRILKPQGSLILTLDNLAHPLVRLRSWLPFRMLHGLGVLPYKMGASCGPSQLRKMLQVTGFHVDTLGGLFHSPRVLVIPFSRLLERFATSQAEQRFLNGLKSFEKLSRWPTRFLTGHYLAAKATKRGG